MTIDERGDATGPAALAFGAVILAAGASSRMGQPKLLLPWGGTTVLGHLIDQWRALKATQITVVHAAGHQTIAIELDRLGFPAANRIANPQPDRGMFGSIQCAAAWGEWNPALTHAVIVLGDQPHLLQETLQALLGFAASQPQNICQPSRRGRPRHPVVLPKPILDRMRDSREQTLKQFLQHNAHAVVLREMDDPGLDFDLDTPADYEQALSLFRSSRA
jgi:molybdenum cofactor cytidylyltransferase